MSLLIEPDINAPAIPHSTLTIETNCIKENVDTIKKKLGSHTRIMGIVKASGYGTNMITMAKLLESVGVDILGVAHIDEAITLRKAGIKSDIFVIYAPKYHLQHVVDWNLQVAICDGDSLKELENIAVHKKKNVPVHLHVNTGMNRFGCSPKEALKLANFIHHSPWLTLEGIMSHFHSADLSASDHLSEQQIEIFDHVIAQIESQKIPLPWKHMANSSAASRFDLPQYNMARIGIGLYGAHLTKCCSKALPLKLALTLTTKIVDIKRCKQGETVSYEASYTVQDEEEIIGTLGIGYHDGLHRNYSNKASCCINGKLAPYIGNICMDFSLVNLTNIPDVSIGDEVTIFGHSPSGQLIEPRDLTALGKTNPHEMLACIGPRVHRQFIIDEYI
jgi:Alr-MurF fusion protein